MRHLSLVPIIWAFLFVQFTGTDSDVNMFMLGALPTSFAILAYAPRS